jgi:hypothetical protein
MNRVIKKSREACRITQGELSNHLGIHSQGNFSKMETGGLVTKSTSMYERKSAQYLLPLLEKVIESKREELKELEELSNKLKQLSKP